MEEPRNKYKLRTREEMQAFISGHLLVAATQDSNANVLKLFQGSAVADADAKKAANSRLFSHIIRMLDNTALVIKLSTRHPGDGVASIQTIKAGFETGDAMETQANAHGQYYGILTFSSAMKVPILTPSSTAAQFDDICNQLLLHQRDLAGSAREVSEEAHCLNLKEWVARLGDSYQTAVDRMWDKASEDQRKSDGHVQTQLANIIRSKNNGKAKDELDEKVNVLQTKVKADFSAMKAQLRTELLQELSEDPTIGKFSARRPDKCTGRARSPWWRERPSIGCLRWCPGRSGSA